MPKKFSGEDTRGLKAKAQKKEALRKKERVRALEREKEEAAAWDAGADKRGAKRRAEEADRRRAKEVSKREKAALLAEEEERILGMKGVRKGAKKGKGARDGAGKVSRRRAKRVQDASFELSMLLGSADIAGSGMDAALGAMEKGGLGGGGGGEVERHPEKRRKAAFKAYEERELERLKTEKPGLRRSQRKELIFKAWQKAPENPMNQESAPYNAKKGKTTTTEDHADGDRD